MPFSLIFATSCKKHFMKITSIKAPVAAKIPTEINTHGDVRIDNYFWMRLSDEQKNEKEKDSQTNDVLGYLNEVFFTRSCKNKTKWHSLKQ